MTYFQDQDKIAPRRFACEELLDFVYKYKLQLVTILSYFLNITKLKIPRGCFEVYITSWIYDLGK